MIRRRTAVALLASPPLLTGCGGGAEATERRTPAGRPAPTAGSAPRPAPTAGPAPTARTKELLRTLAPGRHPVVVMGYADRLARRAA
ncbi:hypothetical protein [Streptomyces sp. NPDC020362]|uniref:hypothetical protein n=1 Tax=unclassified Streptomyces TaxID=2593676 RepID=UPI0033D0F807